MDIVQQKIAAAEKALDWIEDGMLLGLGTGSTADRFVEALGKRVADGLKVTGVATSETTAKLAEEKGVPLVSLDAEPHLDIVVDGADEIDPDLRLIKGGGGALLREKIVAMAGERMIVIADESKLVKRLGAFPLPIEVEPFGLNSTGLMIEALAEEVGCSGDIELRRSAAGEPFKTDGGHFIFDCKFGEIPDPDALSEALTIVPGVIETGLFITLADIAVIGGADGVSVIEAPDDEPIG